ncbi:zinc finger, CCHC-type containing protein [Tanacetum coccineum]
MKENETINDFSGKIGGIMAKFKSLGSRLDEEVTVRKLLNSAQKKYLPIITSMEQYSEIETMSFEEAWEDSKHMKNDSKAKKNKGDCQGDKSGFRCYVCRVKAHFARECTKWKDDDNEANLIQEEELTLL